MQGAAGAECEVVVEGVVVFIGRLHRQGCGGGLVRVLGKKDGESARVSSLVVVGDIQRGRVSRANEGKRKAAGTYGCRQAPEVKVVVSGRRG